MRRAAKRQAAPRPLLKEKHRQARLSARDLDATRERRRPTPAFRPYRRVWETRGGGLRSVLPTFSPSAEPARPLASVERSRRRPLSCASRREACGNYAAQRAAGAAPGMRRGGAAVPAGPPPPRCPPGCLHPSAAACGLPGHPGADRGGRRDSCRPQHLVSPLIRTPFKSPCWLQSSPALPQT